MLVHLRTCKALMNEQNVDPTTFQAWIGLYYDVTLDPANPEDPAVGVKDQFLIFLNVSIICT